jgi:hypothetical protein
MPSLTSFLTIGNTRVKVHTTDDADASPTPEAPVAAEELPIKEIVLDKPGRLLIDVVENTPRGKQTYRHRVSLDVMGQASPVWKEKIFGPAGQERQKPTANDNDDNDEDWTVLLRDDDDEPLHILVQLALIHDQPRWVPTWSDPATPGSCLQIANIIAAAEKYGVLPRLRPFVSDWLLHALPPSRIGGQDDINPEMIEQLNVAWQLGDVGRVEDYIRKLAYDSNVSAEVVEEMLVEAGDGPVGLFPALPALFGVVAKRREAGIQACLDFLLRLLLDLRSNEGACRQPMWDPTIIPRCSPPLRSYSGPLSTITPRIAACATLCSTWRSRCVSRRRGRSRHWPKTSTRALAACYTRSAVSMACKMVPSPRGKSLAMRASRTCGRSSRTLRQSCAAAGRGLNPSSSRNRLSGLRRVVTCWRRVALRKWDCMLTDGKVLGPRGDWNKQGPTHVHVP